MGGGGEGVADAIGGVGGSRETLGLYMECENENVDETQLDLHS